MTLADDMPDRAVLVAIDVAKHRNEVQIEMPWLCNTSTWRSFTKISSGLSRFPAISGPPQC